MAETFLFSFAVEILEKLRLLAMKEQDFSSRVGVELLKMEEAICRLQPVLVDAEQMQLRDPKVKDWLENLKEVVYDAEDLVGELSFEDLRMRTMTAGLGGPNKLARKVRLFFSHSKPIVHGVTLARRIREIRERLDEVAARMRLDEVAARMSAIRSKERLVETPFMVKGRKESHPFVPEENDIVGRKDDKRSIMERLLDFSGSEHVSVIPIVGLGGLGKTTLARMVYNDHVVNQYFDLKMWVSVPYVFDVKEIVRRAMVSATSRKHDDVGLDQLDSCLKELLDGKRYLLVLDDVWTDDFEKWSQVRNCFVCCAKGSKIIVTTRSIKVGNITGTLPPYHLKGLSLDESWSLFKHIAFVHRDLKNRHAMIRIGKKIVKKCVGVPLAIKTIGSILSFKNEEDEWSYIAKNVFSRVLQEEFDIFPTLKLSYDHLSSPLKRCFLYCSLFPRGYEINVKSLIQLWSAQGLIWPSSSDQSLEDIGLKYFEDLASRYFFEEVEKDRLGNVLRCKMHDLIHDLAIILAGTEATILSSDFENIDEKTRHVSFDFGNDDDLWQLPMSLFKATKLRTFLSLSKLSPFIFQIQSRAKLDEGQLDVMFCNLTGLLVLDLHDFKVDTIPHSISRLKHLRLLDLSYNDCIERLPNCITRLQNLQVLNLSYCDELKELPKDIKYLVNLRHLKFEGCWNLTYMPQGLGQLASLQTLTWFVVVNKISTSKHVAGLNELGQLNKLRGKLEIRNLGHMKGGVSKSGGANLQEKEHLQSLSLYWGQDDDEYSVDPSYDEELWQGFQPHPNLKEFYVYDYAGVNFPSKLSSLTNLTTIWIQDCKRCKYLPKLDGMQSLTSLVIRGLVDLEYIDYMEGIYARERSKIFQSLKTLWLSNCPNLKGWWWNKMDNNADNTVKGELPRFSQLSSLQIRRCPNMRWMPLFPSLEEWLWLEDANIEPLRETMNIDNTSGESTSFPLSKLKKLCIERTDDLESISEKFLPSLTSLQELKIYDCPSLTSLSKRMHQITSLRLLEIRGCPLLKERCGDKSSDDWPCIAHIPNIQIDNRKIQWEGSYRLDNEESFFGKAENDELLSEAL